MVSFHDSAQEIHTHQNDNSSLPLNLATSLKTLTGGANTGHLPASGRGAVLAWGWGQPAP